MPRKSWWARLPFGLRMTAGTGALLVLIGGGAAGIAALTKQQPRVVTAVGRETATGANAAAGQPDRITALPPAAGRGFGAPGAPVAGNPAAGVPTDGDTSLATDGRTSQEADRTATREPRRTGDGKSDPPAGSRAVAAPRPPAAGATSSVTSQTVTETRDLPFRTQLVRDPSMPRGSKRLQTAGVAGVEPLHYLVTYASGKETRRRLLDSSVTRPPQDRVIAFGSQGGWQGHDHRRECGPRIGGCLLGRSACPDANPATPAGPMQEGGALQSGSSLTITEQDLALLDADGLNDLAMDPSLAC